MTPNTTKERETMRTAQKTEAQKHAEYMQETEVAAQKAIRLDRGALTPSAMQAKRDAKHADITLIEQFLEQCVTMAERLQIEGTAYIVHEMRETRALVAEIHACIERGE